MSSMIEISASVVGDNMQPVLSTISTIVSSATEEQRTALLLPILNRCAAEMTDILVIKPTDSTTPVKAEKAEKVKAPKAPKKEKPAPAPLPEPEEGVPTASDYLVAPDSIDLTVCVGRSLKGGEDKRWKPIIFRETQCGGKIADGSDICVKCIKRQEKFAETGKQADWNGRVTEAPLPDCHMLDTEWASKKQPKFLGSSTSDAGSVASEENGSVKEEMPAAKKSDADKAAAVAAKAAEKEAKKVAAAAEKEAAKAAKAAEKEAAKEAAKAAKAAEKAASAAVKKAAPPKAKKVAEPEAKIAATTEPVEVEGELKLIDGTLYMVKKGNVYEYEELTEKAGDFVGRLTADETIDADAEEESAAESDSD